MEVNETGDISVCPLLKLLLFRDFRAQKVGKSPSTALHMSELRDRDFVRVKDAIHDQACQTRARLGRARLRDQRKLQR